MISCTSTGMARCSKQEWGMYPEGPKGYDATLRCTFDGKHKATNQSQEEITHAMLLGKSRLGKIFCTIFVAAIILLDRISLTFIISASCTTKKMSVRGKVREVKMCVIIF